MNVFILSDLEGIPGVTEYEQMDPAAEGYQKARRSLTEAINKTADYCFEAGAENVYYLDGHAGMARKNVIEEELSPRLIRVTHIDWNLLIIEKKVDCIIELGSHARAGTINGFLDHTRNSKEVFSHKVNGREFSELALHAAFAGEYGIPTVACIGDEAACEQAKEYIPEIYTAAIKKGLGRNKAVEVEDPYRIIRETVLEALKNYRNVGLFTVEKPITIEMTYYRTDMCEARLFRLGDAVIRKDARTLVKVVECLETANDLNI